MLWKRSSTGGRSYSSILPPGGSKYLLQHTVGNMDVLHGDDLSQFIQAVHILDFIQELHTAEEKFTKSLVRPKPLNILDFTIPKMKIFLHCRPCLIQHLLFLVYYLIKGLDIARTVRMNHVGWAITKDFRFFLSLKSQHKQHNTIFHLTELLLKQHF